jgi:hypothetical protein
MWLRNNEAALDINNFLCNRKLLHIFLTTNLETNGENSEDVFMKCAEQSDYVNLRNKFPYSQYTNIFK